MPSAAWISERAGHRCEYCRMHDALQGATFHVEHIVPTCRGGNDDEANLAYACPGCNLQKSSRTMLQDPLSGEEVPMFHPRTDDWHDHFDWDETELLGTTPIGRALIAAFDLNSERRLRIRQAEALFGLFPPSESS